MIIGSLFVISLMGNGGVNKTDMYLASKTSSASVYAIGEDDKLSVKEEVIRGTKVVSLNKEITYEEKSYTEILYNDSKYYVLRLLPHPSCQDHRAPQTLGISYLMRTIKVSFVMLMR